MATQDFANQVNGTIAQGFTSAGMALGTKLGLFKGLADLSQSKETSVTTQQLADSLNYKERYVREWINGMVCGDVVDHEEIDGVDRYWLEPYRLPVLLGDKLQWPAVNAELLIAGVHGMPLVEKCFSVNGPAGTQIDDYPDLHIWLAKRSVHWYYPENCHYILKDDPTLIAKLEQGVKVLELGSGAGKATQSLAIAFPKSTFMATDVSAKNLERAQAICKDLPNVSCQVMDACSIPAKMHGQFDLVMLFDVYHDVPQPQMLVKGAFEALKKGGQFLMNDIGLHETLSANKADDAKGMAAIFYTISTLYCVPSCLSTPGGEGLGACAGKELYERRLKEYFPQVEEIAKELGLFYLCTK